MKALKIVLIIIVAIVAIPLLAALFIGKEFKSERTVVINKPVAEVFEYVKHIKNQDEYSVWNKTDPAMKKTYTGEDAQVGFISAWESNDKNVGMGEQEITKIVDNQRIDMKLRFKKPFEGEDDAYMTTEALDSTQTKVNWGFSGKMPYPMNIMLVIMDMDKEMGTALQGGLNDMKKILESR